MILNRMKKTLSILVLALAIPFLANAELQSLATIKEGDLNIGLYQLRQQYQLRISNLRSKSMPTATKVFVLDTPTRLVVDIPGVVASKNTKQNIKSMELQSLRMGKHDDKIRIVLDIKRGYKIAHEYRVDSKTGDIVVNMGFAKSATTPIAKKSPAVAKPKPTTTTTKAPKAKVTTTITTVSTTVTTKPAEKAEKNIKTKVEKKLASAKIKAPVVTEPIKELKLTESEEEAFSRLKSELSKRSNDTGTKIITSPVAKTISSAKIPVQEVASAAGTALRKNKFGASKITVPNTKASVTNQVVKKSVSKPFKIEDNPSVATVRESLNLPEKKSIAPVIMMKGQKPTEEASSAKIEKKVDATELEKKSPLAKKSLLKSIAYKNSRSTGKGSIELDVEGETKFGLDQSDSNPNLFVLQLSNSELSNQDLSFPHFAPDNFKGFEVVIPRKTEKGLSLHIYSSKGVTPKAYKRGQTLVIEAQ